MIEGWDSFGDEWEVAVTSGKGQKVYAALTDGDGKAVHTYTPAQARALAAALLEKANEIDPGGAT